MQLMSDSSKVLHVDTSSSATTNTEEREMTLSFEDHDDVLVVRPKGKTLTADRLDHTKRVFIERVREKSLVAFDLSSIRRINSSGLGLLLTALKAVHKDGDMRLFGAQPHVRRFLHLTRLDCVLTIDPDEETAISNLRESQKTDLAS
jgi:anti-anti-sigma factor